MQRVRHLIYSCAANEPGMMIPICMQDYILFKYTVYLAPSSVKLWSVRFLMDSSDTSSWLGKVFPFLKYNISVLRIAKQQSAEQL